MNDNLKCLEEKLLNIDCSQALIEKTSEEFLNIVKKDDTIAEDLVKLWRHVCMLKSNKLPYVYLANDIIQNSAFKKMNFHEVFFKHLLEVFPLIYPVINDKVKKEIHRLIDIWSERNIYDSEKLVYLKNLLTPKICIFENLNNPLFPNLILNKKIKISPKIVEFATSLKNLSNFELKNDNKLKKTFTRNENLLVNNENKMIVDDSNNDKVYDRQNSFLTNDELNNLDYQFENNCRGQVLRFCSDGIKKQNQIFFKHVFYLQELDKMLEKINNARPSNSILNTN